MHLLRRLLIRLLKLIPLLVLLTVPAVAEAHDYVQAVRLGVHTSSRSLSTHCNAVDWSGSLAVGCRSSADQVVLTYRFALEKDAGPVDWHVHFAYRTAHVSAQASRSGTRFTVTVRSAGVARFDVSRVVIGYYTHG